MTDPTGPISPDHPASQPNVAPSTPTGGPTPPPAIQPDHATPAGLTSPAAPAKRSNARAWAVGSIALVIAVAIVGTAIGASSDEPKTVVGTVPSASLSTLAPAGAAPTTTAPTTAAPSPTKTTPPPKPRPPSYKTLSARQWKLIAKNPDAYLGKHYVVYGRVTQFDAATGTETFRADVAHRRMSDEYDYETNTMLSGSESDLTNLVEDDIFRADVTVLGSLSYDTQIGGQTTVPLLQVDSINVL